MKLEMIHHDPIETGFSVIVGIVTFGLTHMLNLTMLNSLTHPYVTEIITGFIRLGFTGVSAAVAFLSVHYTKKYITKKK